MIDIHAHFLPGLDDGAKDYETGIHMAKMAQRAGVTDIIATPHCAFYPFQSSCFRCRQ